LSFRDPVVDCRHYAIERMSYELGISPEWIGEDGLRFITRVLYRADGTLEYGEDIGPRVNVQGYVEYEPSENISPLGLNSSDFGEYEVDYIFVARKCAEISPNSSEVQDFRYIDEREFNDIIKRERVGPWVRIINECLGVFDMLNKGA
jgi:isopentenyldiphosphate isomerase